MATNTDIAINFAGGLKSALSAENTFVDGSNVFSSLVKSLKLDQVDSPKPEDVIAFFSGLVGATAELGIAYKDGGYSVPLGAASAAPKELEYIAKFMSAISLINNFFKVSKEYREKGNISTSNLLQLTDSAISTSRDLTLLASEAFNIFRGTTLIRFLSINPLFLCISVGLTAYSIYSSVQEAEEDRIKLFTTVSTMGWVLDQYSLDKRLTAFTSLMISANDPQFKEYINDNAKLYAMFLTTVSDEEIAKWAIKDIYVQKALLQGLRLPFDVCVDVQFTEGQVFLIRDLDFWKARVQLYKQYFWNDKTSPWFDKSQITTVNIAGYHEGYFGPNMDYNFNVLIEDSQGGPFLKENSTQYLFASGAHSMDGGNKNDQLFGDSQNNYMSGDEGNDILKGYEGNDRLAGEDGNDVLYGGQGADILTGEQGGDTFYGGDGDDLIGLTDYMQEDFTELDNNGGTYYGGKGDDIIAGANAADTYYFQRGDGNDIIFTKGGEDILVIGGYTSADVLEAPSVRSQQINVQDLLFTRDGGNLVITVKAESSNFPDETINIMNWFKQEASQQLAGIELSGQFISKEFITKAALTQIGTLNQDTLVGVAGFTNTLIGLDGNDVLQGSIALGSDREGDTYQAGKGSDQVIGTNLSDKYIYEIDDGHDVIFENNGQNDEVITNYSLWPSIFYRVDNNLIMATDSRYNSVRIMGWFESDSKKIEKWTFANGQTMTASEINAIVADGILGTEGNDELNIYSSNTSAPVFVGGAGDDTITTWSGSSTILFSKQDGNDTINLRGKTLITTGAGLSTNFDVFAQKNGAVKVLWSTGESLLLNNIDDPTSTFDFSLVVENGFSFTRQAIVDKIVNISNESTNYLHANSSSLNLIGYAGADELWGDSRSQELNGGTGADILYGNGGEDKFLGEGGNDIIYANGVSNGSTFFFSQEADNDTVYINNSNPNKVDTLRIVRGKNFEISPVKSDLLFVKKDAGKGDLGYFDAIISLKGRQDSVTIKDFFNPSGANQCAIDRIVFDDGTIMDYAEICDKLNSYVDPSIIKGTPGVDSLRGNGIATKIYGLAGNDTIVGSTLSETIDAGADNDSITAGSLDVVIGGGGADLISTDGTNITFKIGKNSGADTISLSNSSNNYIDWAGVLKTEITARINGNDLVIAARGDSVTLQNYFNQNILNTTKHISAIRFDDGSMLNNSELLNIANYSIDTSYGTDNNDVIYANTGVSRIFGRGGNDTLGGSEFNDIISGDSGDDILRGNGGNDILYGGSGADTLDGGRGYDMLYGGEGNDVLGGVANSPDAGWYNLSWVPYGYQDPLSGNYYEGGVGNDVLYGTSRADVYFFNLGDGQDQIYEVEVGLQPANQVDVIKFGEGISSIDISVYRSGVNLVLKNKTNSDSITIMSWFSTQGSVTNQVEAVEFSDGVRWTASQLTELGVVVQGSPSSDSIAGLPNYYNNLSGGAGNDTITGGSLADTLNGDDGDDTFNAGGGDDIVRGGFGNDTLRGDDGNDILHGGSGADTLDGGRGYDMLYGGEGNDVLGGVANSPDAGWYNLSWVPYGYQDPLSGNYYEGGVGNDVLYGTSRADVYFFNLGDGQDQIYEVEVGLQPANQVDVIKFGGGISYTDIVVSRSNGNLVLKNKNNSDSITIMGWFSTQGSVTNQVEAVEFSDGVRWTASQLTEWGLTVLGTPSNDTLTGLSNYSNTLIGGAGTDKINGGELNDLLKGDSGDDSLYAAGGNDILYGGSGNDTLDGGRGYDMLYGGEGNDTLGTSLTSLDSGYNSSSYIDPLSGNYYEGGVGDDTLYGTSRADVYFFNLGDGQDFIKEVEIYGQPVNQADTIKFGEGISPGDIIVSRSNGNLVLKNKNNSDSITIMGWFSTQGSVTNQVEAVEFSDGVRWTASQLTEWSLTVLGTPSNDTLTGLSNYSNTILGGAGSDKINGGELNDILKGDAGDDSLYAGGGDDILYGGSGNDALDGGRGYDMLYGGEGNDTLGTSLNSLDSGYNSSSYIDPLSGNYYEGGVGDDTLYGTSRADIYFFNLRDGQDIIREMEISGQPSDQADTLKLGNDIYSTDILVSRSSSNLVLKNKNNSDSITILNWFSSTSTNLNKLEQVQFADGTVWGISELESRAQQPTAVVNAIVFSPGAPSFESSTSSLNNSVDTNLSLLLSNAQQDFVLKIGGTGYALNNETLFQNDLIFKGTDGYLVSDELLNKSLPTDTLKPTKII